MKSLLFDATSVDVIKIFALAAITSAKAAYTDGETAGKAAGIEEGKAAGLAEAQAALPTDAADAKGAVVIITKGDKTVTLYAPDKVKYIRK